MQTLSRGALSLWLYRKSTFIDGRSSPAVHVSGFSAISSHRILSDIRFSRTKTAQTDNANRYFGYQKILISRVAIFRETQIIPSPAAANGPVEGDVKRRGNHYKAVRPRLSHRLWRFADGHNGRLGPRSVLNQTSVTYVLWHACQDMYVGISVERRRQKLLWRISVNLD